jgi:hypothetical protein
LSKLRVSPTLCGQIKITLVWIKTYEFLRHRQRFGGPPDRI